MIAVIGDIHGCYKSFRELYAILSERTKEVYCVGDIVDRGSDSKECIQYCINRKIKSVKGNHEEMLLNAMKEAAGEIEDNSCQFRSIRNGGKFTLVSYSAANFVILKSIMQELGHYEWMSNLPLKIEIGQVVISHAGIIENGDDHSIIWNRETLKNIGKLQVIGHTPHKEAVYEPGYYLNLDTGCVYGKEYGNVLTGALIDETTGILIDTVSVNSYQRL